MTQIRKSFRCFRCHYWNNIKVPHYFKGLKCKKCNSFNYFNYIPNYKKMNCYSKKSNNYNNSDDSSDDENSFDNDSIDDYNPFYYNNTTINSIYSLNNELLHMNNNIIFSHNSLINNFSQNQINIRPTVNYVQNNFEYSNIFPQENNFVSSKEEEKEEIIIPWLAKQKFAANIKNKYKNEKCSICLEEINGNISIAKCKHIFHYQCLTKYINISGKQECPLCRSDLKTGKKKKSKL